MHCVINGLRLMKSTNCLHGTKSSVKYKFSKTIKAFVASSSSDSIIKDTIFTEEHVELRRSLNKIIEKDINPYVDEWEAACRFPAHHVFKKLGTAGFLGLNKPKEYGGMALDFTFTLAMAEELGIVNMHGFEKMTANTSH